eukprot:TRINITY_DN2270_c0_g1_i9.p1 TRINITY_DN2270_c0_g1~~TRINITY_DN2270_c0_g1_i9.p1  ORF type:complete len:306 (-),score=-11.84 TRINITY_DN2270_c0_g1_i9:248-1126(-)
MVLQTLKFNQSQLHDEASQTPHSPSHEESHDRCFTERLLKPVNSSRSSDCTLSDSRAENSPDHSSFVNFTSANPSDWLAEVTAPGGGSSPDVLDARSSFCPFSNLRPIFISTKSDTDVVYDGYKWKKYGQKEIKGSPYPRRYYRCSVPSCLVRKQVERSVVRKTEVVSIYKGCHNHSPVDPSSVPSILRHATEGDTNFINLQQKTAEQYFSMKHCACNSSTESSVTSNMPSKTVHSEIIDGSTRRMCPGRETSTEDCYGELARDMGSTFRDGKDFNSNLHLDLELRLGRKHD